MSLINNFDSLIISSLGISRYLEQSINEAENLVLNDMSTEELEICVCLIFCIVLLFPQRILTLHAALANFELVLNSSSSKKICLSFSFQELHYQ